MDIGLYPLKYPFRKLIACVLPLMKNVPPNWVSWFLVPIGLGTALCYRRGADGYPELYLAAIGLMFLRMFFGTLDGLMAEQFQKKSPSGEIANRLTPEICDVLYMTTLAASRPEWTRAGIAAIGIAWMITFSGLIGLAVQKPVQSVGPAGQTDRLAALILLSLLQYFSETRGWGIDFILIFLYWVLAGGCLTVILRLHRNFKRA